MKGIPQKYFWTLSERNYFWIEIGIFTVVSAITEKKVQNNPLNIELKHQNIFLKTFWTMLHYLSPWPWIWFCFLDLQHNIRSQVLNWFLRYNKKQFVSRVYLTTKSLDYSFKIMEWKKANDARYWQNQGIPPITKHFSKNYLNST